MDLERGPEGRAAMAQDREADFADEAKANAAMRELAAEIAKKFGGNFGDFAADLEPQRQAELERWAGIYLDTKGDRDKFSVLAKNIRNLIDQV